MTPKLEKKILALQKKMSKKYPDVDIVYLYDERKKVCAIAYNPDSNEWFNVKTMKPVDTSVAYFDVNDQPFDFDEANSGGAIAIEVVEKGSKNVVTIAFDPTNKVFFNPQTGEPVDASKYVDGEGKDINAEMFLPKQEVGAADKKEAPADDKAKADEKAKDQKEADKDQKEADKDAKDAKDKDAKEAKPEDKKDDKQEKEAVEVVEPEADNAANGDLLAIQAQQHQPVMDQEYAEYPQDGSYAEGQEMYDDGQYGYDQQQYGYDQQQYGDNYQDMNAMNQDMYNQQMYDMNGMNQDMYNQQMYDMNGMNQQFYDSTTTEVAPAESLEAVEKDDEPVAAKEPAKAEPVRILDDASTNDWKVSFKADSTKPVGTDEVDVVEDIYSHSTFNSNISGLRSSYVKNPVEQPKQDANSADKQKADAPMFSVEDDLDAINFKSGEKDTTAKKKVEVTTEIETSDHSVWRKSEHNCCKHEPKADVKSMVDEIEDRTEHHEDDTHDRYPRSRRRGEIYAKDAYESAQRRRIPYDYVEEEIFIRPDVSETSEIRNIRSSVLRNPRPIPNAYYYDDAPEFVDYNYPRPVMSPYAPMPLPPASMYRPRRAAVLLPSADRNCHPGANALIATRTLLRHRQQMERRARFDDQRRDDLPEVFGYKGPFTVPSEYYYRRFSHHYPLSHYGYAAPVATYYDPAYHAYTDYETNLVNHGFYPPARPYPSNPYPRVPVGYYGQNPYK